MMTVPFRARLLALIAGLVVFNGVIAQATGRDAVSLDTRALSVTEREALRKQLGAQLILESDTALVASRKDLTEAMDAVLPLDGLQSSVELKLDPFFARRRSQVTIQRVYGPQGAATAMEGRLTKLRAACVSEAKKDSNRFDACFAKSGGPQFEVLLAALRDNQGACEEAFNRYDRYLSDCSFVCPKDGASIRSDFDNACLASSIGWRRADGVVRADPEPGMFRAGGLRDGVQGAWNAVVLVELDDERGISSHHCGGLLLSDNRILTAAHCFITARAQTALRDGRAYARLVREGGEQRYALKANVTLVTDVPAPAQDYVVLSFESTNPVAAPRIELREPVTPGPAVILGYFSDYDTSRQLQADVPGTNPNAVPTWRQGLRWAKPGLCHVLEAVNGCVRTLCQTVPGYSGAPIFSLEGDPAAPLIVYGVVSGPDSASAKCGRVEPLSTLAASAKDAAP